MSLRRSVFVFFSLAASFSVFGDDLKEPALIVFSDEPFVRTECGSRWHVAPAAQYSLQEFGGETLPPGPFKVCLRTRSGRLISAPPLEIGPVHQGKNVILLARAGQTQWIVLAKNPKDPWIDYPKELGNCRAVPLARKCYESFKRQGVDGRQVCPAEARWPENLHRKACFETFGVPDPDPATIELALSVVGDPVTPSLDRTDAVGFLIRSKNPKAAEGILQLLETSVSAGPDQVGMARVLTLFKQSPLRVRALRVFHRLMTGGAPKPEKELFSLIKEFGDVSSIPYLRPYTSAKHYEPAALLALGGIRHPRAFEILKHAFDSTEDGVPETAASALLSQGTPAALRVLLVAQVKRDARRSLAVQRALGSLTQSEFPPVAASLTELLKDRDAPVRVRARKLLEELGDRQPPPPVIKNAHADPSRPERPDSHGD